MILDGQEGSNRTFGMRKALGFEVEFLLGAVVLGKETNLCPGEPRKPLQHLAHLFPWECVEPKLPTFVPLGRTTNAKFFDSVSIAVIVRSNILVFTVLSTLGSVEWR